MQYLTMFSNLIFLIYLIINYSNSSFLGDFLKKYVAMEESEGKIIGKVHKSQLSSFVEI